MNNGEITNQNFLVRHNRKGRRMCQKRERLSLAIDDCGRINVNYNPKGEEFIDFFKLMQNTSRIYRT